ncbi:MAG: EAL domain-containing protein [Burkholderiaceae bacterium]
MTITANLQQDAAERDLVAVQALPCGALLEQSNDLLVVVDAEWRVCLVNRAVEHRAGLVASALVGRKLIELGLFGPDEGALQAALESARNTGQAQFVDLHGPGAEPDVHHYRAHVMVERDASGPGCRLLVQARDTTEFKRVEENLRLREREFRTLAENSPDNIIRYGLDLRATFCNREIEGRVAVEARHIVGRTPTEGAPPGMVGVEAYELQVQRTLATGESGDVELQVPHPTGELRVHGVVIRAEFDAAGVICGALAVGRDITEQVLSRQALANKEREFRTLAENSPDVIMRYDTEMRIVYCSPAITATAGVSVAQILGKKAMETMPPGMVGGRAYVQQLGRTLSTGARSSVELQAPHTSGEIRTYDIEFTAERGHDGAIVGALAVGREMTRQVRVRRALAAKEREFRSLAENAGDNIMRWGTDGRVRYLNPAMAEVLALPVTAVLGLTPQEMYSDGRFDAIYAAVLKVASEGEPAMLELRFPGLNGVGMRVHQVRMVPERDERGAVCSVLGIGRDITESIAQRDIIESLARTDSLTQLANRQALHDRVPGLFASASRRKALVGVMLLDVDQFKSVNDGMGHSVGDALLCEIARRLTDCTRANDLLVRLGGDEFVVVTPDISDARAMSVIAAKVHTALARPVCLGGRDLHVTASIGVALYPNDGDGLEQLLAHADSAMYHAKRNGRARTEYYHVALGEAAQRRLLLAESMRAAQHGDGLELHYQPQVCLARGNELVGAEALMRWRHPSLGLLAPDMFIPLAEESGLIVPMGRWALNSAAETAARWNRGRATPLRIAVNVSTRQIVNDDLPAAVEAALRRHDCDPRWLSVEITESALLEDSSVVQRVLGALRALGVQVAIDDFGTGYSALNYLARFDVDCLKIDKSFVQGIGQSSRQGELVKAFIAMAGALGLGLVAEGIETDVQAEFLLEQGCAHAQGYRFGRPMPVAQFEREFLGAGSAALVAQT